MVTSESRSQNECILKMRGKFLKKERNRLGIPADSHNSPQAMK